jgi:hypothetical protein
VGIRERRHPLPTDYFLRIEGSAVDPSHAERNPLPGSSLQFDSEVC